MLNHPLASHYSITSSARASSVGGTVRPSVRAAFRLIMSWYLVGCWKERCRRPLEKDANARHSAWLRARRERPRCRRTAEQRDEIAPPCMSRKEHCEG